MRVNSRSGFFLLLMYCLMLCLCSSACMLLHVYVSAVFYVSNVGSVSPPFAISAGYSCCHIDAPAPIRFQRLEACATDMAQLPLPRYGSGPMFMLASSNCGSSGFEPTDACSVARSKFFTLHRHSLRLFVGKTALAFALRHFCRSHITDYKRKTNYKRNYRFSSDAHDKNLRLLK